jgi:hypothetical protein
MSKRSSQKSEPSSKSNDFALLAVGRIAEQLRQYAGNPAEVLKLAEELAQLDSKISESLMTIDQMFTEANVNFDWSIKSGEDAA